MNPFKKLQFRLDRNLTVLIATGMVCATVLLFATFVWPTPYTYQKVNDVATARINPLTASAIIVWPVAAESPKPIASRGVNGYTDDELLQWKPAKEAGERQYGWANQPPSRPKEEKSFYLGLFLGIGCTGTAIAAIVWFMEIKRRVRAKTDLKLADQAD